MGLKILLTADWHLDSPLTGFSPAQRQVLKEAQSQLPGKIADLCRREECDLVLLAGDIFDGPASRETLDGLKRALEQCQVPVLIAPGNHDHLGRNSPWTGESWPENVLVFPENMEIVPIPARDCRIYGAGFDSMDCPGLLGDFAASGDETYQIGLFHGDPLQKNSPCNPITAAQVRQSGLDLLALGHIHKAGTFRAGKTLVAWPGCPMGRGWDETGEKGVCIITLGPEPEIRAVSLNVPKFHQMELDIGEDPLLALEQVLPAGGSQDFFRITLTGWGTVELSELYDRLDAYPNLELRSQVEPPMDLWQGAGEDSLEGVYLRSLQKLLEEEPENEAIILLAAEISQKIMQGKEVKL